MVFSNEEKRDMVRIFYLCQLNESRAAEMYLEQYPERHQLSPRLFLKLDRQLRDSGSFGKDRNKYGSKITEEEEAHVLNQVCFFLNE